MTILNPILKRELVATATHRFFEVRWSCAITSWNDRFGMLRDGEERHGRIAFVISLELIDSDRGLLEAWLEVGDVEGRRQIVVAGHPVVCEMLRDGALLHVDAIAEGARRILALSLADNLDRPAFAQSTLLAEAGLAGGSYDPPTVRRFAARRDAASA